MRERVCERRGGSVKTQRSEAGGGTHKRVRGRERTADWNLERGNRTEKKHPEGASLNFFHVINFLEMVKFYSCV